MMTRPGRENIIKLLALYLKAETNNKIIEMNSLYNHIHPPPSMRLLGFVLGEDGLEQLTAKDVAGASVNAGLKSLVG